MNPTGWINTLLYVETMIFDDWKLYNRSEINNVEQKRKRKFSIQWQKNENKKFHITPT
jgi:hypothetical protein